MSYADKVFKENVKDISLALDDLYDNYDKYKWQESVNRKRVESLFSWKQKTIEYIDFLNSLR